MELKNELEKLKSYFGTVSEGDLPKFKQQYKLITENFTSKSEIQQIEQFIEAMIKTSMNDDEKAMDEIKMRVKLIENREIIPFAYIARNYFKKSKDWLYQRLNGNIVNGHPAMFTPTEIQTLHFALQDISKKLGSIA